MKALPILIFGMIFLGIFIYAIFDKLSTIRSFHLLSRASFFRIFEKLLLIFSILGLLVLSVWDYNYLKITKAIPHHQYSEIDLDDFKGFKKPFETLYGEKDFAFISTSIKVKKKKDAVEVLSLFHPCRSYVYNRDAYSPKMLEHELYHFHITEYFARLLRKEIDSLAQKDDPLTLRLSLDIILYDEEMMQREYDDETYHSYVNWKQEEWENKIDNLLAGTEAFSNTLVSLKQFD